MRYNLFPKLTRLESGVVITLVIAIVIYCGLLIGNIQSAKRAGVFNNRTNIAEILQKNKQTHLTSVEDVGLIDAWMTFEYINALFNIPASYLQESLDIQDSKYPKIPVGKYIKINRLNRSEYLLKVKKSVRNHVEASAQKR
jgi:hypothetical protein